MEHAESSMPLFWKIFGGAIIGLIGAMLVVIISSINANTISIRTELLAEIAKAKEDLTAIRTQMQVKTDAEMQFTKIKEDVAGIKEQIAAIEESRIAMKEKVALFERLIGESAKMNETAINNMLTRNKEMDTQSQELREKLFNQIRELREKVLVLEGKTGKIEESK